VKIAIIGAGSSYTPEIIEGLAQKKDRLPVTHLSLMDINPSRLDIMAGFCRRFLKRLGHHIPVETTTDRRRAIDGASFVLTQIRVGGNAQRTLDEKIPLKYGVIGQETTGPGGMFNALRTIPVMLSIAHDVEEVNPHAWIINYTNPTGMVAEAISKYSPVTIAGLCAGGYFPRYAVSQALDVPGEAVTYDYFGLNHLNFASNLRVNGRLLTDEEFTRVAEIATGGAVEPALLRTLHLLPSPYLQYYYHHTKLISQAKTKPYTRGEVVQQLEEEIFRAYADPAQDSKPEALSRRGGGGYSEIALAVMEAACTNVAKLIIVNAPNRGAVPGLPDDAVLELPCLVNTSGIFPLRQPSVPQAVWGLVSAVKNYEQLTIEAAVTGSREKALLALLAHPLVGEYETAMPLLDEMLEANRTYLPQFFPEPDKIE
jgi:6-phospho-beta-glucosidase